MFRVRAASSSSSSVRSHSGLYRPCMSRLPTSLLEKGQNLRRFAPASCCVGVQVQVYSFMWIAVANHWCVDMAAQGLICRIAGHWETRGQPANPGLPRKLPLDTVYICVYAVVAYIVIRLWMMLSIHLAFIVGSVLSDCGHCCGPLNCPMSRTIPPLFWLLTLQQWSAPTQKVLIVE